MNTGKKNFNCCICLNTCIFVLNPNPSQNWFGWSWGGILGIKREWDINLALHRQWKISGTGLSFENLSLCHLLMIDISYSVHVFIKGNVPKKTHYKIPLKQCHQSSYTSEFIISKIKPKYLISLSKYLNYLIKTIVYFT